MKTVYMRMSRAPCGKWRKIVALVFAGAIVFATAARAAPRISVSNATVTEGQTGSSELVFTVSIDDGSIPGFPQRALADPIVVAWQTTDLTAHALAGDYVPISGTVWFNEIPAFEKVRVSVHGDRLFELDETVALDLLSAVALPASEEVRVSVHGDRLFELGETVALDVVSAKSASIANPRGIGSILNDDAAPSLAIADATVVEGDVGTTGSTFVVTLSEVSGADATVDFSTMDGTARSVDGDFQAVSGQVRIPVGSLSQRIVVEVFGELQYELAESFSVNLDNPVNAVLERSQGIGTVLNDDASLGMNLVGNPTFLTDHAGWAALGNCTICCKQDGMGGAGPHSAEMVSPLAFAEFGIDDSPNWVLATPAAGTRYRVTAWVWGDEAHGAALIRVNEYQNHANVRTTESRAQELTTEWQKLVVDVVSDHAGSELDVQVIDRPARAGEGFHVDEISVEQMLPGDIPPEMTLPGMLSIRPGVPIALDVVVSDVDAQSIDALSADLSDFPASNLPTFECNTTNSGGRLQWTPRNGDLRPGPYQVRFTAVNTSAVTKVASLLVDDGLVGPDDKGGRGKLPLASKPANSLSAVVRPNPARDAATLSVTLAKPGPLHVALYDIHGRQVGVIANGEMFATGAHAFDVGGHTAAIQLSKGVYFYIVRSAAGDKRGRFVILE